MITLLNADRYWHLFQDLPPPALMGRYVASWAARAVGLAAGIGILQGRERFRRLAIVLGCGTVATVQWKHPYGGFVRHIGDLERRLPDLMQQGWEAIAQLGIDRSDMIGTIVIIARLQEIALALLLIWYFTRPRVNAYFHP